jgi:uncharacterized membrane protein
VSRLYRSTACVRNSAPVCEFRYPPGNEEVVSSGPAHIEPTASLGASLYFDSGGGIHLAFCTECGAQIPEGMSFCGSCGAPAVAPASTPAEAPTGGGATPVAATNTSSGLTSNVAAALAYLTVIPAIIFLVVEPYNKDRFVRFHSFQCLFLFAAGFIVIFGLRIFAMIPVLGWIVGFRLIPLLVLAIFGLVLFTMYKAYNNEKFMLPFIGKLAEQQAAR